MSSNHCAIDGHLLEIFTDGNGAIVVHCDACRRRRARRCIDCGQPVIGRSWRCEMHKRMAKEKAWRLHERRNHDELRAAKRKRYWENNERRERRNAELREWRRRNPMKVAMQKRRARLGGANGYRSRDYYLKYQAEYNAKRAAAKREYMKTKAVWFGKKPRCAKCGGVIAWDRRGRPKKYHPRCNPWTQRKAA